MEQKEHLYDVQKEVDIIKMEMDIKKWEAKGFEVKTLERQIMFWRCMVLLPIAAVLLSMIF